MVSRRMRMGSLSSLMNLEKRRWKNLMKEMIQIPTTKRGGSSGIWKAIPSGRLEQEEAEIYNSDYGNEAVDFSNTNQATETGGHDFSSLLDNNYNIRSNSNSNSNSTNDAHHNYNIFLSDDHAHMMHDQYPGFSNGDDGGNSDGGSHNDESDY
mmetsp:Transcript_7933/g.12949  ORF Transcript_7933/g.12949 Transcript_7933/m.12949 type:complete len:153 (+) Transcript_7933:255-713(+)